METVVKKRKPFGFYVCSLGFTFERCSFYTVKYMLAIWIAVTVGKGGLGFDDVKATSMAAIFVAMTYITPIVGGYLADYWLNPRISIIVGMILMGVGYLCTWQAKSLGLVWAMIILVSVGTGLFKGNLSGVNGLQFSEEDELNEAFSIQYSFVNIGSFIGTTFLVLLIPVIGYNGVFLICAILMFIDAIWFIVGGSSLGELGKKPFKVDQRQFKDSVYKKKSENQPLTSTDKKRILAIILVTLFSVVFWCVWYLAYYPAYFYFGWGDGADFLNRANWMIGNFQVPTSYFDSMNALTCIVLGPILGKLWTKMARRPKGDISMFKKTALGIALVGISYLVMVFAAKLAGTGQTSLFWIALVSLLMSVGEMIFSPLGNSFISKLAPSKLMGLLLGLWPIAVFFSQMLYPRIYALLKTDIPAKFMMGYGILGIIVIALGLMLWFASKTLDKLEKEE
ncbi:MAG: peptide MFS transporter [Lachnospiraceae bacterium]